MVSPDMPALYRWLALRLARVTAWRFKPSVVSIAGTAGKTTTKAAIAAVLAPMRRVRIAPDHVPAHDALLLTLLADQALLDEAPRHYRDGASFLGRHWFFKRVIGRAAWRLVAGRGSRSSDVCVAEFGSAAGIREMLKVARPTVAVLTPVGEAPATGLHGGDDPFQDYARTVEQLPAAAFAVVPAGMPATRLRQRTRAHLLTYGTDPGAHVLVAQALQERDADGIPGVSANLGYGGTTEPVYLKGALGPYHASAAAAAACVGIVFGATLHDVARALESYLPPEGSVRVMKAVKESLVIADAYDAHLLSAMAGMELLASYPAKRRIVVLGDLIDLGSRSMEAHERLGELVREHADALLTVGTRAGIAAEAALRARMPRKAVQSFARAEEAGAALQELLRKGDVVLVVGSKAMRLEAVLAEVRMPTALDIDEARLGAV